MVHLAQLISVVALLSVSSAAPMVRRQGSSGIGMEIPVSAPNGTPTSDPIPAATDNSVAAATDSSIPAATDSSVAVPTDSSVPPAATDSSSFPPPPGSDSSQPGGSVDSGLSGSSGSSDGGNWVSTFEVATSTAWGSVETPSYSPPIYGSGSSTWASSYGGGYESCVQQCAASYGQPSGMWNAPPPPPPTSSSPSGDTSIGNGVTHTVIVAPTQGVLRYIPFSLNASVGDTIHYVWGAGPHTVTRSSALEICNKTSDSPFASGSQQKGFTFDVVVSDTKPIWFYCGVPTHCQKGMFGGVNIGQPDPTGDSASAASYVSLGSMMPMLTQGSSDMLALWSYTKSQTGNNEAANSWGLDTNVAGMSNDTMMNVAANVMYGQTVVAANPNSVKNGQFFVSPNMTIPQDINAAMAASPATPNSPTGVVTSDAAGATFPSSTASASGLSSSPSAAAATKSKAIIHNGASALASQSVIVGLVAVVATFFVL